MTDEELKNLKGELVSVQMRVIKELPQLHDAIDYLDKQLSAQIAEKDRNQIQLNGLIKDIFSLQNSVKSIILSVNEIKRVLNKSQESRGFWPFK